MLGVTGAVLRASGAVGAESDLVGAWSFSEASGTTFADSVGGNDATLDVPAWTVPTHEHNRPGIVVGSDHALEVSNGGPAVAMVSDYRQPAMSLVLYVEPLSELRGVQFWDSADLRFGREFLAYCDDGSTPGSFAIERRRYSSTEWRLDGYVRNGSGTAVRFSGGSDGISGATLPVGVSKRIVLVQGASGATLYLDGTQVANLSGVTQGWSSLTTAINLGSSSDTGHANERSPLWGRIDQIEVWHGDLSAGDVAGLAEAVQSNRWRYPSDFVGAGTDIDIADYGPNDGGAPERAMDAAAAASRYVYQAESDDTWWIAADQGGDNAIRFKPGCKGFIRTKLRRPSNQDSKWDRIFNISAQSGGQMGTTHGDPYAGSGGWKFIGCEFDSNSRGQDWHPQHQRPGYTYTGFDLQQAHIFFIGNSVAQTFTFDACDFMDGTGDAVAIDANMSVTVKSCRFWGVYRGSVVINALPIDVDWHRSEVIGRSRSGFGDLHQGCGFDIEPFSGSVLTWRCRDVWIDSDFDEISGSAGTTILYANFHQTGGAIFLAPSSNQGAGGNDPGDSWEARYSTISYHSPGGNGGGTYPPARWSGFPAMGGTGALFDHVVFVASGDDYTYHESWITTPSNSKRFYIDYGAAGTQTRLWTMRDCEWRAKNLPAGISTLNVQAIDHSAMGTGQSVELDGVTIDAAFADLPFDMGGVTVRHRNVVHARTGDTTPWSNAGAEVSI